MLLVLCVVIFNWYVDKMERARRQVCHHKYKMKSQTKFMILQNEFPLLEYQVGYLYSAQVLLCL